MSSWADEVKQAATSRQAAETLGYERRRGSSFAPCPICKADTRGGSDTRGALGLSRDGKKWLCWACQDGGDVMDFVAAHVFGQTSKGATADQWKAIRRECQSNGWCSNEARQGRMISAVGASTSIVRSVQMGARLSGSVRCGPIDGSRTIHTGVPGRSRHNRRSNYRIRLGRLRIRTGGTLADNPTPRRPR